MIGKAPKAGRWQGSRQGRDRINGHAFRLTLICHKLAHERSGGMKAKGTPED